MARLRIPFFVISLVAIGLVVLVELGSPLLLGGRSAAGGLLQEAARRDLELSEVSGVSEPPGRAIGYLALVDVILLYSIALMAVGLVVPDRLHGRLQGILTLVGSIVLILVAIVLLLITIVELSIMVSLFLATPFGTIAYLAVWGYFPRSDASIVLSLLMALKLIFALALVLAHQRFLQNKGLVLLVLTSFLCNVIVAFLHGFVPIVVVSIVDDLAAAVLAVVAIVWALVLLIGSIPAIVKAARVTLATVSSASAPTTRS
ncbi:hypothetical protein [Actinopolymorpha alba]|uniref:hypothetical protein n=1 Tax=Actinopolymorpha alba TaxID=533267 RepID=UPI00036AAB73|nr:hypothetical protein [Actinopolymorpha alba]